MGHYYVLQNEVNSSCKHHVRDDWIVHSDLFDMTSKLTERNDSDTCHTAIDYHTHKKHMPLMSWLLLGLQKVKVKRLLIGIQTSEIQGRSQAQRTAEKSR